MKNIYFVRHGEAEGNVGKFSQTPGTSLTQRGLIQADKVAQRLANLDLDTLVASSYTRAQQTAEEISKRVNLPIESTSHFIEFRNPKRIGGVSHDSPEYQKYVQTLKENYSNPDWQNEDGETFSLVLERAKQGAEFLEQHQSKNIAVVSHGTFLRFFLIFILNQKILTPETALRVREVISAMTNTGITHFQIENDSWKLITWNDHAHFAE